MIKNKWYTLYKNDIPYIKNGEIKRYRETDRYPENEEYLLSQKYTVMSKSSLR